MWASASLWQTVFFPVGQGFFPWSSSRRRPFVRNRLWTKAMKYATGCGQRLWRTTTIRMCASYVWASHVCVTSMWGHGLCAARASSRRRSAATESLDCFFGSHESAKESPTHTCIWLHRRFCLEERQRKPWYNVGGKKPWKGKKKPCCSSTRRSS